MLLAVSHTVLGKFIAEAIASTGRVTLVAQVANGQEVIPTSTQLRPDIVLLDFRLPGISGLEVTKLISRQLPQIRVVLLLNEENGQYIEAVKQSGASGYLMKGQVAEQLAPLLDKLKGEKGNDIQTSFTI